MAAVPFRRENRSAEPTSSMRVGTSAAIALLNAGFIPLSSFRCATYGNFSVTATSHRLNKHPDDCGDLNLSNSLSVIWRTDFDYQSRLAKPTGTSSGT